MLDPPSVPLDLRSIAQFIDEGADQAAQVLRAVLARSDSSTGAAWIYRISAEDVFGQLAENLKLRANGKHLPLFGVPFAVKDNIDVARLPTTAGCPAFRYIAETTAPVVQRLLDAGAILIGKTNLDQFGCGLAGERTPYGVCRNLFDPEHIAGGSSSGSALAVAAGLVSFALGTDTAGSGRIPAGCNNIVGLKPTVGLLSTQGLVPACQSLDCVSVFALCAEDAQAVCEVAIGKSLPEVSGDAATEKCYAVPRPEDLEFFGDAGQEQLYRDALAQLDRWGWSRIEVDYQPFRKVALMLYEGPWLAERWAGVGEFIDKHPNDVHPATYALIREGARYTAADLFQAQYHLQELRATCLKVFERAEIFVVPTLPALPKVSQVESDSRGWGRRLGTYTNFVNLLGLAGIALPAGFTAQGLPGGITLIGPAGSDRRLCQLGSEWQARVDLPLGATGARRQSKPAQVVEARSRPPAGHVRVAVAGAHLRGQPLHADLLKTGARFVRACRTAARYRFLALMHLDPPRPGLLREEGLTGSAQVEIYDLPLEGFGVLVASVLPPLAIGTIELEDGEEVKGFLCESRAAAGAKDITHFGGWIAFRKSGSRATRDANSVPSMVGEGGSS